MRNYPQNTAQNRYPFGISMQSYSNAEYNYSFGMNTQEKDDEIYGEGNSYSAEYWQYDARLGRRWNLDQVVKPHESPYAAFANNPIWFVDIIGADSTVYIYSTSLKRENGEVVYEALTEAELIMIRDEMQKINEQNGIFLKYKIVTPDEFKNLSLSNTDFELNLTFEWDDRNLEVYGETGKTKGLYSDIYMNRVEGLCRNHGIKKGSGDYNYVAAFVATHELMHQTIIRSENLFGIKTTESSLKGHNNSSIPNLNTDGTTVLNRAEKGNLINELRKTSILITNQHNLIQNYFRYIELENELNKFLFYDNLNDREKLKKEMRSIYHNPTGQGKL